MTSGSVYGHAAAILTVLIWGTTFISTKVLLAEFQPVELLFFRFVLGYLALWAACPRRLKLTRRRQELYFAAAGLCGVTLYFLLENIALTYTQASNVGVLVAVSPIVRPCWPNGFWMGSVCVRPFSRAWRPPWRG